MYSPFSWKSRGGNLRRERNEQQTRKALDAARPFLQRTAQDTERQAGALLPTIEMAQQFRQRQQARDTQQYISQRNVRNQVANRPRLFARGQAQRQIARAFEPEPMDVRTRQASIFRSGARTPDEGRAAIDRDRLRRGGERASLFRPRSVDEAAELTAFARTAEGSRDFLRDKYPNMLPSEALKAELESGSFEAEAQFRPGIQTETARAMQEIDPNNLGDRLFDETYGRVFDSPIPEPVWKQVERVPYAGEPIANTGRFVTSPGGAALTVATGGQAALAGTAGSIALGAAGRVAEDLGAPAHTGTVGEVVGGLTPAGVVKRPGIFRQAARQADDLLPSEQLRQTLDQDLLPSERLTQELADVPPDDIIPEAGMQPGATRMGAEPPTPTALREPDLLPPSAASASPSPAEVDGVRVDVDEPAFGGVGAARAPRAPTMREVEATTANPIATRRAQAEYKLSRLGATERNLTYEETRQAIGDRGQRTLLDPIFNAVRKVRGQNTKQIQDIRNEMIVRDSYVRYEGGVNIAKAQSWLGRNADLLGADINKGKLTKIQIRPGAKVNKAVAQTPKDIARHPEDYIFTPEQQSAWDEIQEFFQRTVQNEQRHGLDVTPIDGYYWPEVVIKAPAKMEGMVYRPLTHNNMSVSPWFTKSRTGIDPRTAGPKVVYANDFDALFLRAEGSAEAVANRSAIDSIKAMGYKPSERVATNVAEELAEAQAAYKDARKLFGSADINEVRIYEAARDRLKAAKTAMRAESRRVNQDAPKLFGRVVPQDVAQEFSRYIAKEDPDALDEMFRAYRAIMVNGDYGSPMLQNYALLWNSPKAWLKSTAMGAASIRKAPFEYIAQNEDEIIKAVRLGFISPPTELMLSAGGGFTQKLGKLPVLKQAQRMFEWNIFVGQLERAKAHMRVGLSDKELRQIADVTRKQAGVLFEPGTTAAKAKRMSTWFFAPQYTAALNAIFLDPITKSGAARREAIKSLGSMLGGAAVTAVGFNMLLNNELPNMDDPKAPGFWGIKLPDGSFVYPFGPLQPTIKTMAELSISRDPKALPRFLESKASIGGRWFLAAAEAMGLPLESVRGPAFGRPDEKLSFNKMFDEFGKMTPGGVIRGVQQAAEQGLAPLPIGAGQTIKAIQRGAPFGILESFGVRTTLPPSEAAARYKIRQELDKIAPFTGISERDRQKITDFENEIRRERQEWLADPANAGREIEAFSKSVAREAPIRLGPELAEWATLSEKDWLANINPERDQFILDNWEVFNEHYPSLITNRLAALKAQRGRATNPPGR